MERKEAIEIVRKLYNESLFMKKDKEAMVTLIPELKESEDERIREEIVDYLKKFVPHCDDDLVAKSKVWIAWLEKQGKETSWKPSKEEMDVLYGLSYITNKFDERKEEVITRLYQDLKREFFNGASFENMFSTNTSVELEKQGEKSNIHQDAEDDLRCQHTIRVLEYARSLDAYNQYGKESINKDIAWIEKQGEKESDPRYENLEEILAADDIYQMSMNDEMVQEAKEKAVNALSGMCIGRLLGLEKQGKQKSTKNIMNVWKDMRLEVYQQASGNRHEPNYSDDTTKMFSLNDIDEIIEKMSEQKPIISNNALREGIAHFGITQYQIDNWLKKYVDVEGNYYDGVLRALRVDELYKLQEKQGKPKPADKIETKQNPDIEKGKWYVCNTARYTDFVVGKAYYCPKNGMLKPDENEMARYVARNCFRLWTIQDAKDGDVLATDKSVFIYAKVLYNKPYAYCGVDKFGVFKDNCLEHDWSNSVDNIHPAIKEQRELLFQKMKEAGYEWDFEKKELRKVEQKSKEKTEFYDSMDDLIADALIEEIENSDLDDSSKHNRIFWIKSHRQKLAWSEEDEGILKGIICEIEANKSYAPDYDIVTYDRFLSWLKSLKDKV